MRLAGAVAPRDEAELEERLSRPSLSLAAAFSSLPGDLVILGGGGKMGPTLARMARRADPARRVVAVARWSDRAAEESVRRSGVETLTADLLDARALAALPDAQNVVFMAGQKFGTTNSPANTWAMNAAVPSLVSDRYRTARTVVFSTGNVYPLSAPGSGGSSESAELAPVGEYAWSCLARERIFAAAAARYGTPTSIIRLNYAHDLRYGVLTDIATRIARGEPVDVGMGYVNVIWQGDANAIALAALSHTVAPEPAIINVAGREILRVADIAGALGERLGVAPTFSGVEHSEALLSNASRMHELFPDPLLPLDTLLDWVASWVRHGGRLLGKPTGFERRDGRF